VPGINQPLAEACYAPFYRNRYFFYRLEHVEEVESLCKSELVDFYQDDQAYTTDKKLFEEPTWPHGEWNLNLFGGRATYRSDGQTSGGLWIGDRKIDCDGNLRQHGKLDVAPSCLGATIDTRSLLTLERP
jgi:hypothetical protein